MRLRINLSRMLAIRGMNPIGVHEDQQVMRFIRFREQFNYKEIPNKKKVSES